MIAAFSPTNNAGGDASKRPPVLIRGVLKLIHEVCKLIGVKCELGLENILHSVFL
jgi:hypothetical protein